MCPWLGTGNHVQQNMFQDSSSEVQQVKPLQSKGLFWLSKGRQTVLLQARGLTEACLNRRVLVAHEVAKAMKEDGKILFSPFLSIWHGGAGL